MMRNWKGERAWVRGEDAHRDRAADVVIKAFGGVHRLPGGQGIRVLGPRAVTCLAPELSTFDLDRLTQLVFAAHDLRCRVELLSNGPPRHPLRILVHAREETGGIADRHPGLEEAVGAWRSRGNSPWRQAEETHPDGCFVPDTDGVPSLSADCDGDGHYLCRACVRWTGSTEEWPGNGGSRCDTET